MEKTVPGTTLLCAPSSVRSAMAVGNVLPVNFHPKLRRCSLLYNGSFHKSYSQRRRASGGSGLERLPDEGAMLLEALEVLGFFVRGTLLPESPQDLQPTFAQATKSARMTMAGIPF